MPAIICEGVDITEHVGAMFDALVSSIDWGSGFLSDDEIEGILVVASLAGFDAQASPSPSQERKIFPEAAPLCDLRLGNPPEERKQALDAWQVKYDAWRNRKRVALENWRAQFKAKAEALRKEANER